VSDRLELNKPAPRVVLNNQESYRGNNAALLSESAVTLQCVAAFCFAQNPKCDALTNL
jgi:hypothetical protein